MAFQLRIVSGPDEGTTFQLPPAGIQGIGRSHAHCDLVLHDLTLDRVHCELLLDDNQAQVQDNDSSTGTFLNGERISKQPLKSGDIIRIGGSELCFELIQEVTAAPQPVPVVVPTVVADPLDPLKRLAGTVLSHFQLGDVVGVGRVGVVFRARDVVKNRDVALKVLRPEFPHTEDERQRFVQTVKALMLLRHANLVLLYGAGPTPPYYWLAYEFLDGGSAAQWIQHAQQSDRPDWRPAFRLAVNVGWALQAVHQYQLVHANVTPQHIVFHKHEQVFKLTDLVTNKALTGSQLWHLVLKDKALSELPYLAPEQTPGEQTPVDGRTDMYSLGAVVYAMLVGRPPFLGDTPAETIALIRQAELLPPRALEPSIPELFDTVVRKMLARRPEDRFQTADQMLAALGRITKDPAWQHAKK